MGSSGSTISASVSTYRDNDGRICTFSKDYDNSNLKQTCIIGDDIGEETCSTVDLGDGYYGRTCYGRDGTTTNQQQVQQLSPSNGGTMQQLSPSNGGTVRGMQYGNNIPVTLSNNTVQTPFPSNGNTVWEVQNGNNRPVTLSESDINMLNSNNGMRRNGDLRIEPLNNGGISIRFDNGRR